MNIVDNMYLLLTKQSNGSIVEKTTKNNKEVKHEGVSNEHIT